MGYDLHITKAEDWTEASAQPISTNELTQLIASDPDLVVSTADYYDRTAEEGDTERIHAILWTAHPEEVSLWFQDGEITAKNPDDLTIVKMLEIAERLHARVLGDDGEAYELTSSPPGWEART
jgi:hypothetical protein